MLYIEDQSIYKITTKSEPQYFAGKINWLDIDICFVSGKNEWNFQPTAKCLVKQKPGLKGGDKWEPWQHCNRSENKYAHSSIIQSRKLPNRVPQTKTPYDLLPGDGQLFQDKKKSKIRKQVIKNNVIWRMLKVLSYT